MKETWYYFCKYECNACYCHDLLFCYLFWNRHYLSSSVICNQIGYWLDHPSDSKLKSPSLVQYWLRKLTFSLFSLVDDQAAIRSLLSSRRQYLCPFYRIRVTCVSSLCVEQMDGLCCLIYAILITVPGTYAFLCSNLRVFAMCGANGWTFFFVLAKSILYSLIIIDIIN